MRKLFLFAAVAAFALSSCSKNEEINSPSGDNGGTIGFRTLTDKSTRTGVTDGENITGFTLSAFSANSQNLFNAFDITRGESDDWSYSPLRYWPGDEVDFYAYSPASSRNITTTPGGAGLTDFHSATDKQIGYKVPIATNRFTPQEDFLVAKIEQQASGTVKLNFQHALSRVLFQAKTTSTHVNYIISGVKLKQLYSTGVLPYAAIPETGTFSYPTDTPTILWKDYSGGRADVAVDMSGTPVYLSTDFVSILGETDALMVMPQQTATPVDPTSPQDGEFVIEVSYYAFVEDIDYAGNWKEIQNAGTGTPTPKTVYFPVKDPNRPALGSLPFEIGRQYNFALTFGSEVGSPIAFEVGVQEWNNASANPIPAPNYATTQYFPNAEMIAAVLAAGDGITGLAPDGMLSYDEMMSITEFTVNTSDGLSGKMEGITNLVNLEKITLYNNNTSAGAYGINADDMAKIVTMPKVYWIVLDGYGGYDTPRFDLSPLTNMKVLTFSSSLVYLYVAVSDHFTAVEVDNDPDAPAASDDADKLVINNLKGSGSIAVYNESDVQLWQP